MRIWVINHYAIPPAQSGGTRHFALAKGLVKRGHEVTILASSFNHSIHQETQPESGENWIQEEVDGVRFLWVRTPAYQGNTAARLLNMLVFGYYVLKAPLGDKPDIIIGSSPHPFAALAAERLAHRYRVPFVLEVRDLWPQTLLDLGRLSPYHPLVQVLGWIERYLYWKSARIITLLPGAVEHMAGKGVPRGKVEWLPNGVDFSLVPPYCPPAERNSFTIVYAGAHGLANGLDTVLDAAKLLDTEESAGHVQIRLIGDGPEKKRLMDRRTAENIRNVTFSDPVPKTNIYRFLQEADAFIVTLKDSPLYRWGMSLNKIFDYLAMGRPIIFGANTIRNPVLEAGAGLVVPPENASQLVGAVKRLQGLSRCELLEIGRRGRNYAEQWHNLDTLSIRLESILVSEVQHAGE